jgi:hypothetical protein
MVSKLFDLVGLRLELALLKRERDELRARLAQLERNQQQPRPASPPVVPIGWESSSDVEYQMSTLD